MVVPGNKGEAMTVFDCCLRWHFYFLLVLSFLQWLVFSSVFSDKYDNRLLLCIRIRMDFYSLWLLLEEGRGGGWCLLLVVQKCKNNS